MYQSGVVFAFVILMILEILFNGCLCNESLTDFDCLQAVQDSFEDPLNSLYTWDFTNTTEGSICKFAGVECWHPDESQVFDLKLSGMGLEGNFPFVIKYCARLAGLDLSYNNLTGALPSNMSGLVPYVTSLDLSSNAFSGEIPPSLSDCRYLNELNLENNNFSGQIPIELTGLYRLNTFNVANNNLTGPVPYFSNVNVSYAGNPSLCGGILAPCNPSKKNQVIVVGLVTGTVVVIVVLIAVTSYYCLQIVFSKK